MIKGVREPLRYFGDEISVEYFALARFRFRSLANCLALLRNPGGGDRSRRAADRAENSGQCCDEIRLHDSNEGLVLPLTVARIGSVRAVEFCCGAL